VLVGRAFGEISPVAAASPTVYLDVMLAPGGTLELPALALELAVYAVLGQLQANVRAITAG